MPRFFHQSNQDSNSHDTLQVTGVDYYPLFKPGPSCVSTIKYAEQILSKNPVVKEIDPATLGTPWLNGPLVSADILTEHHLPLTPTETMEQAFNITFVDPATLAICEMDGGVGRGVFTLQPIKKDRFVCCYSGFTFPYQEVEKMQIKNRFLQVRSDEKSWGILADDYNDFGSCLQDLYSDTVLNMYADYMAVSNLEPVLLDYHGIPVQVYKAKRDIEACEIIGKDYGDGYWNVVKEERKFFTRNGEIISSVLKFSDVAIEKLKKGILYISAIKNKNIPNEIIDMLEMLSYRHKEILLYLTKKEREVLYRYKQQIIEASKRLVSENVPDKFSLQHAAIRYLDELRTPLPMSFNYDRTFLWPSPDETFLQEFSVPYKTPALKDAEKCKLEGDSYYKKNNEMAIARWQEALKLYRIIACKKKERKEATYHEIVFEDGRSCLVTHEVAICYWSLANTYDLVENLDDAIYCFKRCLQLCENDEKKVITLPRPISEIRKRLEACQEKQRALRNNSNSNSNSNGKAEVTGAQAAASTLAV